MTFSAYGDAEKLIGLLIVFNKTGFSCASGPLWLMEYFNLAPLK